MRDKKIDELAFAFKNYYSSFEFNIRAIERLKRQAQQEAGKPQHLFRDHDKNLKFDGAVKLLNAKEGGYRSISVVFLKGDKASIGKICERGIRVGEGGIFEKYAGDEIRMSFVHREELGSQRLQEAMVRFLQHEWVESAKCAIYRVGEQGDLRRDVEGLLYQTLESMVNKGLKVVR